MLGKAILALYFRFLTDDIILPIPSSEFPAIILMTLSKSGNEEICFLLHSSIGIGGIVKLMCGH